MFYTFEGVFNSGTIFWIGNVYFIRLCNFLVFIDFSVHDDFKSVIKDCYAPYAPGIEDQDPFGVGNGSA